MQGLKVTCRKVNSGYGSDYGFDTYEVTDVVSLDGIPTIKVKETDSIGKIRPFSNELLAWFRDGEWVIDLD
tara:strand:- start:413 stop:625 length:213 start_codon:yes stop_codon:yes gene_type:complete